MLLTLGVLQIDVRKYIKDNILFFSALETNTRAVDVIGNLTAFFDQKGLDWENICGICTEGAPVMLEARSGLQTLVPSRSPSLHVLLETQTSLFIKNSFRIYLGCSEHSYQDGKRQDGKLCKVQSIKHTSIQKIML